MNSYRISDSLYLVQQDVTEKVSPPPLNVSAPEQTNHIVVIDCSGSMAGDLPKIREQLKSKLPKILREQDTVSILWFSGRGEYGVLLEGEHVSTLKDLQGVNQAIDRWLKPIGLTGFKEPLLEVTHVTDRIFSKSQNVKLSYNLLFMSDGCDNQWGRHEILQAAETAGAYVHGVTFVEYGYYADRPMLTSMAEKAGGSVIYAQDFDQWEPAFEAVIQKHPTYFRKLEVPLAPVDVIGKFAFSVKEGEILTFAQDDGDFPPKVTVPEDIGAIWYLSPTPVGSVEEYRSKDLLYGVLSLFAQRMNSHVVYSVLRALGDVYFIDRFTNCFGKQKYSEFVEDTRKAAFDTRLQFREGFDPDYLPAEDAFTVMDLLQVLADDEDNLLLLDSKDFSYKRISQSRVDANTVLTPEEQVELDKLTEELKLTNKISRINEIRIRLEELTNKPEPLKFEPEKVDGYSVSGLEYTEDRANIAIQVRKNGTVDLTSRVFAQDGSFRSDWPKVTIPSHRFPTHIYRKYSLITDGIVNVDKLPVRISAGTVKALRKRGLPAEAILGFEGEENSKARGRVKKSSMDRMITLTFDLKALPIINRKMVKEVSAEELFKLEYELCKARAAQKVFKFYMDERFPKDRTVGLAQQYGDEAAKWLAEQGITDGGFAPQLIIQSGSQDFYMGKELSVSIRGLSSLPTVKAVLERQEEVIKDKTGRKKFTPVMELMNPALLECVQMDGYTDPKLWITEKTKEARQHTRQLIAKMAVQKFAIIVGQVWPKEFSSLDQNTLKFKVDGKELEGKIEMREIKVPI